MSKEEEKDDTINFDDFVMSQDNFIDPSKEVAEETTEETTTEEVEETEEVVFLFDFVIEA